MKRAHASAGANRKGFMIRTTLRISLRPRNRTFVNVIAARTGVTLTFLLSLTKEEKTHRSAKLRNSVGLKTAEDFY
jgi:hypothetical protein